MVIKKWFWRPDTCNCVAIQSYDTVTQISSLDSYQSICSSHSSIVGNNNVYSTMRSDNQRKNLVYGLAMITFPSLLTQTDPETGNTVPKSGTKYNWSYSGSGTSRVLTVSFSGATLTNANKSTLQTSCNTQFGTSKVVVQ